MAERRRKETCSRHVFIVPLSYAGALIEVSVGVPTDLVGGGVGGSSIVGCSGSGSGSGSGSW